MSNFTINTEYLESSIRTGHARATVKVKGYWSSDSITLYVRRDWSGMKDGGSNWSVEISHSSGGRDTKEVACDLEAETYYGEALIGLAQYGRELQERFPEFEEKYQAYTKELREEQELKAKIAAEEKAARLAVDSAIGKNAAAVLDMLTYVKRESYLGLVALGEDKVTSRASFNQGMRMGFRLNGRTISRKKLIEVIASCSVNSQITEVQ